jgi:surface protein
MSVIHISYILEIIQFGTDKKVESNLSSWDTKNVGHLVTETLYQKMDKNYSTI